MTPDTCSIFGAEKLAVLSPLPSRQPFKKAMFPRRSEHRMYAFRLGLLPLLGP
jgi:hypothetical protein